MYGVLLPAPDIGANCAGEMRSVRDAGFECGIHTWDHVVWQDNVRTRDAAWTQAQMAHAHARFTEIFGVTPATHGAAGWQMNEAAFRQLDGFGIAYASDGRCRLNERGALVDASAGPYRLTLSGAPQSCVQLPTTLPTLDELLGREIDGAEITPSNIAAHILKLTAEPRDHVFTLHAELEGQKLAPIFEQCLTGWRTQGYDLISMAAHHAKIQPRSLPSCPLHWGEVPGRSGQLIVQ